MDCQMLKRQTARQQTRKVACRAFAKRDAIKHAEYLQHWGRAKFLKTGPGTRCRQIASTRQPSDNVLRAIFRRPDRQFTGHERRRNRRMKDEYMRPMAEHCALCGCDLHRTPGEYANATIEGRSGATKHHCGAQRFFRRSRTTPLKS
jgi:hypothetical protein